MTANIPNYSYRQIFELIEQFKKISTPDAISPESLGNLLELIHAYPQEVVYNHDDLWEVINDLSDDLKKEVSDRAVGDKNLSARIDEVIRKLTPPTLTLDQLDTLGTDGSVPAMYALLKDTPHTRYRVVTTSGSDTFTVGFMDVFMDSQRHVITEVLTTHFLLDESGALAGSHRCQTLFTYFRAYNINSPQLTNEKHTWTPWRDVTQDIRDSIASLDGRNQSEHAELESDIGELSDSLNRHVQEWNDYIPGIVETQLKAIANEAAITQEIADRKAADTALQNAISQEATDRQAADTALAGKITTAKGELQTAISQEAADREAADNALEQKITNAYKAADNAVKSELNDRIDSLSNSLGSSHTTSSRDLGRLEVLPFARVLPVSVDILDIAPIQVEKYELTAGDVVWSEKYQGFACFDGSEFATDWGEDPEAGSSAGVIDIAGKVKIKESDYYGDPYPSDETRVCRRPTRKTLYHLTEDHSLWLWDGSVLRKVSDIELVQALKNRLETLIGSGDVSAVIDTFNEIEAFLSGITNTETLTGLLQDLKTEVLNAVSAGYQPKGNYLPSANYTASDILTKLKTVDGANSGLDADLLDGLHSSDFAKCSIADSLNTISGSGGIAGQNMNAGATIEKGYPIKEAGSLFYGPTAYSGTCQIYGTYNSNRWFARGGGSSSDQYSHTDWREFVFKDSVHNLSSVTNLDWPNSQNKLASINTLAFWNGRYNGLDSNLKYCLQGEFGSIVTANADTYQTFGWYGLTPYVHDATNGVRQYWHKIASLSPGQNHAIIEIIAQTDSNFPSILNCKLSLSCYKTDSYSTQSVALSSSTRFTSSIDVMMTTTGDVWIRFRDVQWNCYARFRLIQGKYSTDGCITIHKTPDKQEATPTGSNIISNAGGIRHYSGSNSFEYYSNVLIEARASSASKLNAFKLTNENLNSIKDDNFTQYYSETNNSVSNKPDGVLGFSLQSFSTSPGWYCHVLTAISLGVTLRRFYNGNTASWGPWVKIATEDDLTPIKDYVGMNERPPQQFIDEFIAATKSVMVKNAAETLDGPRGESVYAASYNEDTNHFEWAGLSDITYEDAVELLPYAKVQFVSHNFDRVESLYRMKARALIIASEYDYVNISFNNSEIESIKFINVVSRPNTAASYEIKPLILRNPHYLNSCPNLKKILGKIKIYGCAGYSFNNSGTYYVPMYSLPNLEEIYLHIDTNNDLTISLEDSPKLSYESVAYMINNKASGHVQLKFHPTVYAKLMGDMTNLEVSKLTQTEVQAWMGLVSIASSKYITISTTS